MAIITDLMQTYDQADTNDYTIAEGIHMLSPTDTPLQLLLPKIQVGSVKAEWIEDELTGYKSNLASTLANTTSTQILINTGDGADKFPEDVDTYNVVIRIDQEYMLVTGKSGDDLTVTRGYGDTQKSTHASGSIVHIVSQMEVEGAEAKRSMARERTRPGNYVQTFSRTLEVSGVQEAVKKLGGITSEIDYQIMQVMRQLALELEKTIIMGVKAQAGNSSSFRTMSGLWSMIVTNRTVDSGSIDTEAIETDIKAIWDAGGVPRAIITSGSLAQDISNIYSDRIRTDVQTAIGGVNINSIVNPLGEGPIAIIPHRMVADNEYYMLDTARISLGYLRPFHMRELSSDGDADKRWIGGDYTVELMNEKAHAYRYGFDV
ncbi:hypothetical protein GF312_02065 [Candidatus Poribacteria bacterium]|nr:hypothetical protein [Candidatus Poribacteria bacterium]